MFDANSLTEVQQWEPNFEDGSIEGVLHMVQHGNANTIIRTSEDYCRNTLRFIWDARKALEIQHRLGWYAKMNRYDRWIVFDRNDHWVIDYQQMLDANWKNPFTAIVEAFERSELCQK